MIIKNKLKLNEECFTLIEALVAILILSIFTGSIMIGIHSLITYSEKRTVENKENIEVLSCKMLLDSELTKIRVPFWIKPCSNIPFIKTATMLEIPYYMGVEEDSLIIGFQDNSFYIQTPDSINHRYTSLNDGYISIIDSNDIPGFLITFSTSENEYSLFFPFTTYPLNNRDHNE